MNEFSDLVVHVGFPKTATTTLQQIVFQPRYGFQLLVEHDGYMAGQGPILEPLVTGEGFDRATLANEVRARMAEIAPGLVPVLSSERLSGPVVAFGMDRDPIAQRLRAALPGVRILVGTREEESFRRSLYRQLILMGSTAPNLDRPINWWERACSNYRESYFNLKAQLEFYRGFFGHDRVIELPYELLVESPQAWLEVIASATENRRALEALPALRMPVNASESPLAIRRQRYANYFRVSALNPHPLVPLSEPLAWKVGVSLEFIARFRLLRRLHLLSSRVGSRWKHSRSLGK